MIIGSAVKFDMNNNEYALFFKKQNLKYQRSGTSSRSCHTYKVADEKAEQALVKGIQQVHGKGYTHVWLKREERKEGGWFCPFELSTFL